MAAEAEFNRVFRKKRMPLRIQTKKISKKTIELDELMIITKSAKSKSEASRLISQGAVRIDDVRVLNPKDKISILEKGIILQVGKRRFFRVKR